MHFSLNSVTISQVYLEIRKLPLDLKSDGGTETPLKLAEATYL